MSAVQLCRCRIFYQIDTCIFYSFRSIFQYHSHFDFVLHKFFLGLCNFSVRNFFLVLVFIFVNDCQTFFILILVLFTNLTLLSSISLFCRAYLEPICQISWRIVIHKITALSELVFRLITISLVKAIMALWSVFSTEVSILMVVKQRCDQGCCRPTLAE